MKSTRPRGLLVTFEGTEGAGKSTLIRAIATQLEQQGTQVTVTREPGGSAVAEQIRNLILNNEMDPWTELFLYEAARAEHLAQTVLPALRRGDVVLCDRFTDSSLAYQGHARGLPWHDVKTLNQLATQGLKPALTVLLDIDPAEGLKHAQERNRFEEEGVKFQKKVRQGFLKVRKEEPSRWLVIPARSGTPEEMARVVVKEIELRTRKRTPSTKAKANRAKSQRKKR